MTLGITDSTMSRRVTDTTGYYKQHAMRIKDETEL
jgi:hypothetical protein